MIIAIVDYKAGNLASVKKAFDHLCVETIVTDNPDQVQRADKIVLPGVGHFATTQTLVDSGMCEAVAERVQCGVPFLGICVGMQWLLSGSEEAPGVSGLGLWKQSCERFPAGIKSPHVGWNNLQIRDHSSRLFQGIPSGSFVYFTHSYYVPVLASTVADCGHGQRFSAAIERDNIFGVQFHPEKSGAVGLAILKNFCQC